MSSDHVKSAVDNARRAIENEIEEHYHAILTLKRRLNDLAPISRLPNEILSEIFVHVARDSFEAASENIHFYGNHRGGHRCVKLTHICHSWRLVAQNAPRPWGFLVLAHKSVADVSLPRSKKAPLHLAISNFHAPDIRDAIEEIFRSESHRLKDFRASGPGHILCEVLAAATQPADILEKLVLTNPDFGPYEWDWDSEPPILPTTLFQGQHPRLRHLELRNIAFNWDSAILCATLTKLVVYSLTPEYARRYRGNFERFLSALGRMVALQDLDLDGSIPEFPLLPSQSPTICLPQLCSIRIHANKRGAGRILNLLTIPPAASKIEVLTRDPSDASLLLDAVRKHLSRSTPFLTIHMSFTHEMLSLDGWREDVDVETDEKAWVSLSIPLPLPFLSAHVDIFSTLYNLEVIVGGYVWPWKELFAGMPQLRKLSVCDDPLETFLPALSAVMATQEGTAPSLVLADLHTLVLRQMGLRSMDALTTPVEFFDELIDCLILRCNYGHPLQGLRLISCLNIGRAHVDRLREVVPEVGWDGVEGFEYEMDLAEDASYNLYDDYDDVEDDSEEDLYGDVYGFNHWG